MYLDPPYPGNGVNYFHNMREWDTHKELAERLNKTKCHWILSSYNTDDVHRMFDSHRKVHFVYVSSASGMKASKHGKERVTNEEVLILNYDASKLRVEKNRPKMQPLL